MIKKIGKGKIFPGLVISLLLVPFVYGENTAPASASHKNFLWEVKSKDSTVYILGSAHMAKKELYPLDKAIENAFDKADTLVVEADIRDPHPIYAAVMQKALLPEGDSLKQHISKKSAALVDARAKELGFEDIYLAQIKKWKPWAVALILSSMQMAKLDYNLEYGMDFHFLDKAEGKDILELEGADYQINLLNNLPEKEQEAFLVAACGLNLTETEKMMNDMFQAWGSGNTEKIEDILKDMETKSLRANPGLRSFYKKFLNERDEKMVSKIEEYLKKPKIYFVIIGAAHVVGKDGVVDLLRKKGYVVNQL